MEDILAQIDGVTAAIVAAVTAAVAFFNTLKTKLFDGIAAVKEKIANVRDAVENKVEDVKSEVKGAFDNDEDK